MGILYSQARVFQAFRDKNGVVTVVTKSCKRKGNEKHKGEQAESEAEKTTMS